MTGPLVDYRHPRVGFSVPLPPGWEQWTDPYDGVALVAVVPGRSDEGFRTNVVVTLDEVTEMDLAVWQFSTTQLLERQLAEFVLLDEDYVEIGGRVALRRLAHHTVGEHPVTMQQWAILDSGLGYTLTASAHTLGYDQVADLLATIAAGLRPGTPEVAS